MAGDRVRVERTHPHLSGVGDALDRALARRARTIGLAEVVR